MIDPNELLYNIQTYQKAIRDAKTGDQYAIGWLSEFLSDMIDDGGMPTKLLIELSEYILKFKQDELTKEAEQN